MAEAAALVGALGAGLLVTASSRAALLSGLGLVLAAMAGLALEGGQADSVATLFGSVPGVAALAAALAVLAAGAAMLVRWPVAIVPLLLAVAPIRLPIASDPDSPVLLGFAGVGGLGRLYPLYAVLAAAVVAIVWRAVRRRAPLHPVPGVLAVPVAAFLALILASFLWSEDQRAATQDLLFFWLPFAVLFAVAAQAPFTARSPRLLAVTLVAVAAVFAALGIWQAAAEELLFFTVSLERANELGAIYRVTAAFQDPNHLGRHLILAIGVVLVAAWLARLSLPAALALLVLLGTALYFTYSQSSLVALVVVALVVALIAAAGRARLILTATAAVLAVAGVAGLVVVVAGTSSVDPTSGRSSLVTDTAAVAARHPLLGVGVSAQPHVTRREQAPEMSELQNVSHTTPLTVAAELGVVGLAAFLALLAGAGRVLQDVSRRDSALALGLAAILLALLVHSLFYPGLFENPIAWGALGVTAAAASQGHRARAGRWAGPWARRPSAALRS